MLPASLTTPHWLCGLLLDIWTAERFTWLMSSPVTAVFHTSSLESVPFIVITSAFWFELTGAPCWSVSCFVVQHHGRLFLIIITDSFILETYCADDTRSSGSQSLRCEDFVLWSTIWGIEREKIMLFSAVSLYSVSCLWCRTALWSEWRVFVWIQVCLWSESASLVREVFSFLFSFQYSTSLSTLQLIGYIACQSFLWAVRSAESILILRVIQISRFNKFHHDILIRLRLIALLSILFVYIYFCWSNHYLTAH